MFLDTGLGHGFTAGCAPGSGLAEIHRRFMAGARALRAVLPWIVARLRGLRRRRPAWPVRLPRPLRPVLPLPRPVALPLLPRPGPEPACPHAP